MLFDLKSNYKPTGDQPQAIDALVKSLKAGNRYQTLQGVTGSEDLHNGKYYSKTQRPTLIIAHNKTLAAQLCQEFREFFPENAVHYFVSYYDYYQPEAYIQKPIHTSKRLGYQWWNRSSPSCCDRGTSPEKMLSSSLPWAVSMVLGIRKSISVVLRMSVGQKYILKDLINHLVSCFSLIGANGILNKACFVFSVIRFRSSQRVKSTTIVSSFWYRNRGHPCGRAYFRTCERKCPGFWCFFPAFTPWPVSIMSKLSPLPLRQNWPRELEYFKSRWNIVAAERIKTRVEYDLEMMTEVEGKGMENYSRHLDHQAGAPHDTDWFFSW